MVSYQKTYQTNNGPYLDLDVNTTTVKRHLSQLGEIRVMRIINVKRYDFDIVE